MVFERYYFVTIRLRFGFGISILVLLEQSHLPTEEIALLAIFSVRKWHSQTIQTRHPIDRRSSITFRSLARFAANFPFQKTLFVFGVVVARQSCLCQKQP